MKQTLLQTEFLIEISRHIFTNQIHILYQDLCNSLIYLMMSKTKILYIIPLFSLPRLHSNFSPRLCTSQKFVNVPALPSDEMSRDRNVSGALGAIEGGGRKGCLGTAGSRLSGVHGRRG